MTTNGSTAPNGESHVEEFDVVVVGAGFGGIYLLYHLRRLGYKIKVLEAGKDLGGVWWANSYPGARVDTYWPLYEFSAKELWEGWTWTERFPGRDELCRYFAHVDEKWDIKKDITFEQTVTKAHYDQDQNQWTVVTHTGYVAKSQFLLLATGFAAKHYVPPLKGLESFQGVCHHTALWPKEGLDLEGKRVGIIGTGASGVQVIQEIGPVVKHLTVFQRTANNALPMRQERYDEGAIQVQEQMKQGYEDLFNKVMSTYAGWDYDGLDKDSSDATPEERVAHLESLWAKGGFHMWLGNYRDLLLNADFNNSVYGFWRDKVRERLVNVDPNTVESLAPWEPENPFGTKRPSLEQNYYEVYTQPNVNLYNLRKTRIAEITPHGVKMESGEHIELDVLILATGFDAVTGSLLKIDLQGVDGVKLSDKWARGAYTSFGMATAGFPNMFFMYGPQGPTAFAIGPRIAEAQGDWIISCLEDLKRRHGRRIEALAAAETEWRRETNDLANKSLLCKANTWYMGSNIPGKPREALNYMGGMPRYIQLIKACAANGYQGFVVS
ncbi:hypothetical protein Z517_07845 [Fonsecaea pedrosoi CBS 271.37]|uniref:FAD/NAD(P)-binding domain-containing protein n=1 Tax=Fonsecaea pedrosoi CBS 271.37 TaxID=1442368 RepID=A0A0D2EUX5_9EURO|nr:uncharacterized protein Z517_07845 [Fonsecaea pedrosoi CBS 271.37]KIW78012.1 hypothetical protein Z517_07845 [Fonsecaea pedrosoi CBS 271.37]